MRHFIERQQCAVSEQMSTYSHRPIQLCHRRCVLTQALPQLARS